MNKPNIITIIVGILTAIGLVVAAVYFMEDRYVDEEEAIQSIEQQRTINDLELLKLWEERSSDITEQRKLEPEDPTLKEKYDKANKYKDRIEDRLYNK